MSFDYSLECVECQKEYILDGTNIKNRKAHEEGDKYLSKFCEIESELTEICKESIEEIIKSSNTDDPKIEYKILVSAGICSEGPIRYPRLRKAGNMASELCQPLANVGWITNNLNDASKAKKISKMKTDMDKFESKWHAEREKENPISIMSLKKR